MYEILFVISADKLLERSLRFVVTFRFIQDPINALNVHWKGDVCIFLLAIEFNNKKVTNYSFYRFT